MRRGEVWEVDFEGQEKDRPVLILSRSSLSPRRPDITVAYLTTNQRFQPYEVPLTPDRDGVKYACVVNADSINTIPKNLLKTRVAVLSPERMLEVAKAIQFALELPVRPS